MRETEAEAWAVANKLIATLGRGDRRRAEEIRRGFRFGRTEAHERAAWRRAARRLEIAPNLWTGFGLVRRGAGTALVGDPKTVAERLREYQALGIETVIASGYPHLEEAYKVAELLFPELGIGQAPRLTHGAAPGEFGVGAFKPAVAAE